MVKKNQAVLGLISLVVLASGCTGNGENSVSVTQTQAVSVQEFSIFPSEVTEGTDVQVTMTLKNTGGSEATSVQAELFNIPFGSGSGGWSGDPGTLDYGTLSPPNPDQGIPATPKPKTVSMTAPTFEESVSVPYDVRANVWFDYSTVGTTRITLMGQDRFRDQGASRTRPSMENTGGPIQMSVRTRSPIVFYQNDQGDTQDTSTQVCIIVNNRGEGTPYLEGSELNSDNRNKLELNVRSSQFSLVPSDDSGDNQVDMVGGRGVKCYDFDSLSSVDQSTQTEVPITVTANYRYSKETSAPVTVQGNP